MANQSSVARGAGDPRVLPALSDTIQLEPVDLTTEDGLHPALSEPGPPVAEGRYIELGPLGRGGLGEVIEAFDQDLRSTVALKRVREDRMSPAAVARLVAEAQVTAQLDHPNIPAVHALVVGGDGRPSFSMTRLRGQNLAQLLRSRGREPAPGDVLPDLSFPRLARIFMQAGYAVAFAHDRGVIHRDLKPENIFVGEFGEVRVIDWGIAKVVGRPEDPELPAVTTLEERPDTRAGTFVGTPGYAAPEQFKGEPVDERVDVWALGCILYEMVGGRRPVVTTSALEAAKMTCQGEFPRIDELVPVSPDLSAVVHKALAIEREDRYQSVLELLADVEALLEGRMVSARPEGRLAQIARWYVGRSARLLRFKTFDIDMLCASGVFFGVAIGAIFADRIGSMAWVCLVVGLICAVPPMYTMLRAPRPDDPQLAPWPSGPLTATERRPGSSRPPD